MAQINQKLKTSFEDGKLAIIITRNTYYKAKELLNDIKVNTRYFLEYPNVGTAYYFFRSYNSYSYFTCFKELIRYSKDMKAYLPEDFYKQEIIESKEQFKIW